jgi:hypothetical protein
MTSMEDAECPITLHPFKNPALIEDGGIYQQGYITRWLDDNDRSPLTNLPLHHRYILRLFPLVNGDTYKVGSPTDGKLMLRTTT